MKISCLQNIQLLVGVVVGISVGVGNGWQVGQHSPSIGGISSSVLG